MKKLERIFLYTVLAILVFYVFLVDENVESKVVLHEEIRAKRIAIVNNEKWEVIRLFTNDEDTGVVQMFNKEGRLAVEMRVSKEDSGEILVANKDHKVIGSLPIMPKYKWTILL